MENQYLDYDLVRPVSQEDEITRAEFIKKTYQHLGIAILGFLIVETLFLSIPAMRALGLRMTQGWTWLLVLGGFMFVTNLADNWALNATDRKKQYMALGLYVVAEAFIFIPIITIALYVGEGFSILNKAGILTVALFAGISAVAFMTKKDYSFLRNVLTVGGILAIGLIVAGMLFGFDLGLWFSVAMVGLAAVSILYQTSNVINHYNKDQYVAASLGLFASFMLLLWYIISILIRIAGRD
ncbi:MAG TPA: Bax inhibitor-1 family protein [Saprospiraceae bacterium]|nr:US12 family protein [Saprospiraceae bacterium]MCB9328382.1 US12 family protein [Lewinellaceae bacterium]HPK10523.1 Bax inhibitor-1 family protein [Saprospiraceae bacterium]HPQ21835.1 Bax inhibitor-1 family protein [Saprospiraceae bacterium]HRX28399.1 Bax inhibitor-1 family protein [Saprospiraceae bacterium]